MTSLHGAIRALLAADTAVAAIVGTRIYPLSLPLNCTLPAITIHKASGAKDHVTGHGFPRYQISCWAGSFATVQDMETAVVDCLDRYKGTASGNGIKQIAYLTSLDAMEETTGIYHIPIDFKIIHFN